MPLRLIQHTDIPQFCEVVWPLLLEAEADYCVHVGIVQRMKEKGYARVRFALPFVTWQFPISRY